MTPTQRAAMWQAGWQDCKATNLGLILREIKVEREFRKSLKKAKLNPKITLATIKVLTWLAKDILGIPRLNQLNRSH
jgi:hypothetical protein